MISEKYYLIDLACMALWSDGEIENEENYFFFYTRLLKRRTKKHKDTGQLSCHGRAT
jgi:hypothetical protein